MNAGSAYDASVRLYERRKSLCVSMCDPVDAASRVRDLIFYRDIKILLQTRDTHFTAFFSFAM